MEPVLRLLSALHAASVEPQRAPVNLTSLVDQLARACADPGALEPLVAEQAALLLERHGHGDGALRAALRARAVEAERASARVLVLTASVDGQGEVVEMVLDLCPGRIGAWTPQEHHQDAKQAVQIAVKAALGAEGDHWSARWQVQRLDGAPVALRGLSVGLGAAAATRRARHGIDLHGWAFTGQVDIDGQVRAVYSLPSKLRAAAEAGLPAVALPREGLDALDGMRGPEGLRLVGVRDLDALWRELVGGEILPPPTPPPTPPPRRGWLLLLAAVGLASMAAWRLWAGARAPLAHEQAPASPTTELRVCLSGERGPLSLERGLADGAQARLELHATQDGYAWLYTRDASGGWLRLFPTHGETATVSAGVPIALPRAGWLTREPDSGEDRFALVWTPSAPDCQDFDPDLLVEARSVELGAGCRGGRWTRRIWDGVGACAEATVSALQPIIIEIPLPRGPG